MVVAVVFIIGVKMDVFNPQGTWISMPRTWMKHGEDGSNNFVGTLRNVKPTRNKKNVQVAILLHAVGPEAQEIHSHFSFVTGEAKANHETILNKFGS